MIAEVAAGVITEEPMWRTSPRSLSRGNASA